MARHITSLKINGYRGLRDFAVEDLADVNILLGDNNCGKTSVLEVLSTFSAITNPAKWLNNSVHRNFIYQELNPCVDLSHLFNINEPEMPISIEYIAKDKANRFRLSHSDDTVSLDLKSIQGLDRYAYSRLRRNFLFDDESGFDESNITRSYAHSTMTFSLNDEPEVSTDFFEFTTKISTNKHKVVKLFAAEYEYPYRYITAPFDLTLIFDKPDMYEELIAVLQQFDPDITNVFADKDNVYKIASRSSKKALPISVFGDGLKLALSLFSALPFAKNGFLLIDEFDTSLHTSQMGKVLGTIITMCKRMNIQLFMTTHSLEAVDKVIECCYGQLDDLRVIRLNKKPERTFAKVIHGELAEELRNVNDAELR